MLSLGASVYLLKYCLFLLKHCLTFSCEQPTIPYRNRNSTEFLYLFILVYATEIINNDYNKVSLVNRTGINYILLQNKNTYAARSQSESVPSSVQSRTFFMYFHSMSAEVCKNIFDLNDDRMLSLQIRLANAFYFVMRLAHSYSVCNVNLER